MDIRSIITIAVLSLTASTSIAQYADEEACTLLASLDMPETDEIDRLERSTTDFFDEFRRANPDLPKEFSEPQDGWLFLIFADCYRQGVVVDKDRERSNRLLEISASQGNQQAAHMVASIKVFQSGDPEKQEAGVEFLHREYTEDGSAYAAGKLGWAYQQGYGVDQDLNKAIELYEYAASRGMTYWQYLLAHAYEKGYLGFEIDDAQSTYWLRFKPKIHVALYECWVATYYANGTFPENEELRAGFQKICDETDVADVWER